MTKLQLLSVAVCVGLGYIAGLGVYVLSRDRMSHKVPAHCSRQRGEDIQNDFPAHRSLCTAHYWARACSGGHREACQDLYNLSRRDLQLEIAELARRYPMIP